jgi:membrane protease YdiL (CAAX protease family)
MSDEAKRAMWAHALPFLLWVAIMSLPFPPPAWRYAVQAGACAALLGWLRPWRYYPALSVRHLPAAFLAGAAVCVVWVLPESSWMLQYPYLHDLYLKYGVRPLGVITGMEAVSPYAPDQCGWGLSLVRLLGSAVAIAAAEEFFWRGFIYRWFISTEFIRVEASHFKAGMFLLTAFLFGVEHNRWLVGVVAGLVYGALYLRTRDIWAAVAAHMTTNFLLGLYVLATAAYGFW